LTTTSTGFVFGGGWNAKKKNKKKKKKKRAEDGGNNLEECEVRSTEFLRGIDAFPNQGTKSLGEWGKKREEGERNRGIDQRDK